MLKSETLYNRFVFEAIRPLRIFAEVVGVDLNVGGRGRRDRVLRMMLCVFWLSVSTGSNCYIFARRAASPLLLILFSAEELLTDGNLTRELNSALFKLTSFTVEVLTHNALVWIIRPTLNRFCQVLESVDRSLGRPDLSSLRLGSKLGLGFICWMVIT